MVSMYPVLWHYNCVSVPSLMTLQLCQCPQSRDVPYFAVRTKLTTNLAVCLTTHRSLAMMHYSVGLTDHDGSGPLSQSNYAKLWNAHCRSPLVTVTLNCLVSDNYKRIVGKECLKVPVPCSSLKFRMCVALLENTLCLVLPVTWNMQALDTVTKLFTFICVFSRNQKLNHRSLYEIKTPSVETRDPVWRWPGASS